MFEDQFLEEKQEAAEEQAELSENGESLAIYMKLLQKIPLLSRKEEIRLAESLQASKKAILRACCDTPDFYSELYLIKSRPLTEKKKLFLAHLVEESNKEEISKLINQLETLAAKALKSKRQTPHLARQSLPVI